jgi:hyperosmotically inducible protein
MNFVMRALARPVVVAALFFGSGAAAIAQEPTTPPSDNATAPQADNTKVNERDRNATEPTADQQKENRSDRDITQQIRKAIVQDKSLSSYAHNVKVITQDGIVTLKGPVRSEEEKKAIEAKAWEVAGGDKVTSQLEVKPQN